MNIIIIVVVVVVASSVITRGDDYDYVCILHEDLLGAIGNVLVQL